MADPGRILPLTGGWLREYIICTIRGVGVIIDYKMTTGNTSHSSRWPASVIAAALAVLVVVGGVANGLWIHLSILAVTTGIFVATVSMRRVGRKAPSGGIKVLRVAPYEADPVGDLDEVA